MKDPELMNNARGEAAMGHLGRITSLKDLPSDKVMLSYLMEAAKLNDAGIKVPKKPVPKVKRDVVVPDYFVEVLNKNKKALKTGG